MASKENSGSEDHKKLLKYKPSQCPVCEEEKEVYTFSADPDSARNKGPLIWWKGRKYRWACVECALTKLKDNDGGCRR